MHSGTLVPGLLLLFLGIGSLVGCSAASLAVCNFSGLGAPIEFRITPDPYGGYSDSISGVACGVNPDKMGVVLYIRVDGRWSGPQPLYNRAFAPIRSDGSWECRYITGGNDQEPAEFAAYLIPLHVYPPIVEGMSTLPSELFAYRSCELSRK
ncbi:MAG TPA: hypothetical protein VN372_09410 [Methanospirillum sp.]|nr:hypothetical protein [Methanospirillum sp.]